jgi:hypothetical protein
VRVGQESMLPQEFADLEPFAPVWSHPDANERYERRLRSTMIEMQVFYEAAVARADAALAYLDHFDLQEMPEPAQNLLWMYASLSAVGFAVDVFRQPTVPDAGAGRLPWIRTPVP